LQDPSFALHVIARACDSAQRYICSRFGRQNLKIPKGPNDYALDVDLYAGLILVRRTHELLPNIPIITEEDENSHLLIGQDGEVIVYDNLDGTKLFNGMVPFWGQTGAYIVNGEVLAAFISQPMLDRTFTAIKGAGAWLNGQPFVVQVSDDEWELPFGLPYPHLKRHPEGANVARQRYIQPLKVAGLHHNSISVGCSVANSMDLLLGRIRSYHSLAPSRIWDVAAAGLIVSEATNEAGGLAVNDLWQPLVWNTMAQTVVYCRGRAVATQLKELYGF
jgi:myo-inositol-1(or 4)-monophosphatase